VLLLVAVHLLAALAGVSLLTLLEVYASLVAVGVLPGFRAPCTADHNT
jgi:hypothetical protein